MRRALKSITCQRTSTASVVDGKLILSFPCALTPVVWQMDLAQAKASALEVNPGKDPQNFTLTLKNPKGENVEVASFDNREDAVDGLMAASRALTSAHGQIRPLGVSEAGGAPAPRVRRKSTSARGLGIALLGILLLVILINVWGNLSPKYVGPNGTTSPIAENTDGRPQSGVPVSADDFLKQR